MALLTPARRGLAIALTAALVAPALAMPFQPFKLMSDAENRLLARSVPAPASLPDWLRLPRRLDAFAADHFAFREPMIRANNRLFGRAARTAVSGQADLAATIQARSEETAEGASGELAGAVDGKRGRMFLTQGLLESTGLERDPGRDADYARFVCQVVQALAARHVGVMFSMAPSPASIYPEDAPGWALPPRAPTDYDLILKDAAACGVQGIDLRPALRAAKVQGDLYRLTDSHWRETGALAAFDDLVQASGHPEWRLDPRQANWRSVMLADGDLPRLAGLPPRAEPDLATPYVLDPPGATRRPIAVQGSIEGAPFEVDSGRPGPALLIVGDSFTQHFFPGFFLHAGLGRVGWIHQDRCRFDWRVIDAFRPDQVLIMPVDRFAHCEPRGARPRGLPR